MKTKEIKENVSKMTNKLISSSFDDVISKINKKEGVILKMQEKEEKKPTFGFKKLAFACVFVLLLGIGAFFAFRKDSILATINLDVNPSLEIKINDDYKIKEVITNNDEAKKVLGDMDLIGSSLEVGSNAIVGSMLKNGYIDEAKNSILVTVSGASEEENKKIEEKLSHSIYEYLETNNGSGSVISQILENNTDLEKLANEYGITIGKAELINKIMANNPTYTFESLVGLSTNELNLLVNSKKNHVTTVSVEGVASDKAKSIALDHVKVSESKIYDLEIDMDYENGIMIYEVDFDYNQKDYSYDINALNGEIIRTNVDIDYDDDIVYEEVSSETTSSGSSYISTSKAKSIALDHAKVTNPVDFDIEFEYKNNTAVYEIDFEAGAKEYEYIINAKTGSIMYSYVENDDEVVSSNNTSTNKKNNTSSSSSSKNTSNYIGTSKAKSIALNHAGVSNYTDFDIELENENGVMVYDINFEVGRTEYEYKVNAKTGSVVHSKVENDD